MNNLKQLEAEIAKVNSFWDLKDLESKRLKFTPEEEKPLYILVQMIKEFNVDFNFGGYTLPEFILSEAPKEAKQIRSIKKHPLAGYIVRCNSRATNEQIESEINKLMLPF